MKYSESRTSAADVLVYVLRFVHYMRHRAAAYRIVPPVQMRPRFCGDINL
jgi:hypothetical protein